ncbi:MAG: GNAT family N-acetyltransferase [bacterium]|nr:GNAT family N-acetyltransferase [bacterium]
MEFIYPNKEFLSSYLIGCKELWNNVHDRYIIHNPDNFNDWEKHIFKDYENSKNGINLPNGFVPSVTYWIIDNDEYIGTINIRFELNDVLSRYGGHIGIVVRPKYRGGLYASRALKFAMEELKIKRICPILITTQETNETVIKCIEHFFKPSRTEKDKILKDNSIINIRRYYFE